jgi:glucose/arabinose dehydrogenase
MAFLASNDFLVLEKNTGKVQRVVSGAIQSTVLDLAVNAASERGLLGIALDPNFSSNSFVYLYWTCRAPLPSNPIFPSLTRCSPTPQLGTDTEELLAVPLLGNRVDRFRWTGSSLTFDRNLIMLRAFQNDGAPIPPNQGDLGQDIEGNHDGGIIRFGPDGKLYIVIGDNGRRGKLQNLPSGPTPTGLGPTVPDDQFGGPDPDNAHFTGVVVRLNSDGSVPPDNPFFAAGAAMGGQAGANIQRIFAYGIRNTFGMSFDPITGKLWLQENGDDSFDEINIVEPGFNSGWIQIAGRSNRLAQFKLIETHPDHFGLQQDRWPPTNIAGSVSEAMSRLWMLPGAMFSEPEFTWKFALAPAAIGFASPSLGSEFAGDLFVGFSEAEPLDGPLFRMNLNASRTGIATTDPRTAGKVADNVEKHDLRESEQFLIGTNFGVVTDIQSGPNGNLFVVSLSKGAVYEIFRQPSSGCATNVTGNVSITRSGYRFDFRTQRFVQTALLMNTSGSPIDGPLSLVLSSLSSNASLFNPSGVTSCATPAGRPFKNAAPGGDNVLSPGESVQITLEFVNPSRQPITYTPQVLAGPSSR